MSKDDVEDHIREHIENGVELSGAEFEGRPCRYCGELIDFTDWVDGPGGIVYWDIRMADPSMEPCPLYERNYFCAESCMDEAKRDTAWLKSDANRYGDSDVIHEDNLEGNI